MKDLNFCVVIIFAILWAILMVLFISGCSALGGSTPSPLPDLTPGQSLTKALANTNWLVTLAIIGAGAGFFAFLNGNGIGLKLIAACLVVISLTLMISWAARWIAAVGIVSSIGLLIYTIWTKDRAVKEIVGANKSFYDHQKSGIQEIFKGYQGIQQSSSTEKIVKNILKKIVN